MSRPEVRPAAADSIAHAQPGLSVPGSCSSLGRVGALVVLLAIAGVVFAPVPAAGQRPPGAPVAGFQPLVDLRTILFSSLAQEVGLLPSPSGGGFTYQFDPATGVFQRSSESLGPVFGERAETTGAGRFTFNVAYSRHTFDEVDGVDLKNGSISTFVDFLPIATRPPGFPICGVFNPLEIREDVTADVGSVSALYGVTQSLDVGVTLPIVRVKIKERTRVRASSFNADPTCNGVETSNEFASSEAENTGIGDINFRAKYNLGRWSTEGTRASLATSLDVRVPTGDEGDRASYKSPTANFQGDGTVPGSTFRLGDPPLGTGIVRVKPQIILTAEWGPVAINGAGGVELGTTEGITNDLVYQFGMDYTPFRWMTLSGDLLGRTAFNVDRRRVRELDICGLFEIQTPQITCNPGADGTPTPGADLFNQDPFAGSEAKATRLAASFGAKFNPFSTVLLFVNFVIPVNDTGFRDDVVFTVGGEWSF